MTVHAPYSPHHTPSYTASTPTAGPGAISVRGLTKTYMRGGVDVPALVGVDLDIASGEQVAIMGPSGSGKTTLLHCLAGIIRPTSGRVIVGGTDVTGLSDARNSRLRLSSYGFVFQDGQLLPELSCEENVALPLILNGHSRTSAIGAARQILAGLGLDGLGPHRPGQLSGGQAQRVAIARALVSSPSVVFADEPTGSVDQKTGADVMRVLCEACVRSGATLVLVTHDPGVADRLGRIIRVEDGRILAADPFAGGAR